MVSQAYINGVEVSFEFFEKYHETKSKVAMGIKLNPKERAFYLLYVATLNEAKEFLKNEKK